MKAKKRGKPDEEKFRGASSAIKKCKSDSSHAAMTTAPTDQEIILYSPEPKKSTSYATLINKSLPGNKTEVSALEDSNLFHKVAVIYSAKIKFDETKVNYVYKLDESRNKKVTVVKMEIPLDENVSVETLFSHLTESVNKGDDFVLL